MSSSIQVNILCVTWFVTSSLAVLEAEISNGNDKNIQIEPRKEKMCEQKTFSGNSHVMMAKEKNFKGENLIANKAN